MHAYLERGFKKPTLVLNASFWTLDGWELINSQNLSNSPPILVPRFDLSVCKSQMSRKFNPILNTQILVLLKALFEWVQLMIAEGSARLAIFLQVTATRRAITTATRSRFTSALAIRAAATSTTSTGTFAQRWVTAI